MPEQFQIFFDFDSSRLNAEAQAVVTQISEAHEKYNPATVVVIGHTDSAGSSDYNIMLSQRRAETVYNALAEKASIRVKCGSRPMAKNARALRVLMGQVSRATDASMSSSRNRLCAYAVILAIVA